MFDGEGEEIIMTGSQNFRVNTFLPIIDSLCQELTKRMEAYKFILSLYSCILELSSKSSDEIKIASSELVKHYHEDLEIDLGDELVHFKMFVNNLNIFNDGEMWTTERLYKIIIDNNVASTFPNVLTALKMYRCLMISNASGERSFSKLKLIKNCLRSTMGQARLNALSIMSIEYEILKDIPFDTILNEFILRKNRKVCIGKS